MTHFLSIQSDADTSVRTRMDMEKAMKLSKRYVLGLACLGLMGCSESGSDDATLCGNGVCEADESVTTCPSDCNTEPVCGNVICEAGETASSCPADCKNVAECGNGVCETGESAVTCPKDCKTGSECGNGLCENSEDFGTCPADCNCGNGVCDADESSETCRVDCAVIKCGDGVCSAGESRASCPADCPPVCGDGRCEAGEDPTTCEADCKVPIVEDYEPVCGDGVCDEDENCDADCKETPGLDPLSSMDEFNALPETRYRFLYEYDTAMSPSKEPVEQSLEDFLSYPYPSETRTDSAGRPMITNYPLPNLSLLAAIESLIPGIGSLIPSLVNRVETERAGFSPLGAVYFRSSVALDTMAFPDPSETVSSSSCFQLINVEPDSKHYGERVPLYLDMHRTTTMVQAANTLVMRPVPGVGPHPGDRYVAVVGNCLKANARKLSQSNKLRYILSKAAPTEIDSKTRFYVEQLEKLAKDGTLGMALTDIRAAAGYDTSDVAQEMDQIAKHLKGRGRLVADSDGVAIPVEIKAGDGGWTKISNGYVFRGQFVTQNYIEGDYSGSVPSYDKSDSGDIRFDSKGKLTSKPHDEVVNFAVSVPLTDMPEKGFPLAVYGHGTGGDATTHCRYWGDEGWALLDANVPMAMVGFDACLQGERTKDEGSETALYMVMLKNPVVVRESVRQTVADMLVLYDLIDSGKFILPPRPGSTENTIFDPSYGLYMGHSQGSQEAGLLLGLTDSVKNAFLSAGGGGVLLSFVDLVPNLDVPDAFKPIVENKSIADLLGMLMGLESGSIRYDTFLTNNIVQPLMDPVDPLNFTPRFVKDPVSGMSPKNIAQTVGLGDRSTPTSTQFAMIASEGLPWVGQVFETNDALQLAGLTESTGSSVHNNITTDSGPVTGGAMQFQYTGQSNPHFVIYYMSSARNAFIEFFRSVLNGETTVSVSGSQSGNK